MLHAVVSKAILRAKIVQIAGCDDGTAAKGCSLGDLSGADDGEGYVLAHFCEKTHLSREMVPDHSAIGFILLLNQRCSAQPHLNAALDRAGLTLRFASKPSCDHRSAPALGRDPASSRSGEASRLC